MHRFFICNQDEIDVKLQTLTKTKTSADGWTHYYFDKNTKEHWHLTRYNSEYHGGGVPVLKRLPEPTVDQLINIAITSPHTNDIFAASRELSEREKYANENFRDELLNSLLQIDTSNLTDFEKKRFKIVIYESELHDSTNRRDIVGKHFTEIQEDAEYYQGVAQKARKILDDIEKYSS